MSRFGNLEFYQQPEHGSFNQEAADDGARFFDMASAAFEEADFESALRSYSKVIAFKPQHLASWTGQVQALIELGRLNEAALWAEKALESFPHEPELLAAKAVALGRSGNLEEAMALSDTSLQEQGATPYVWLARADVLLARGEPRAYWCFEKAEALAPNNWFITWLAARVRCFHQQFARALQLVHQALQWNPGHAVLWLMQGQCQQQIGMIGPARLSFQQALQLKPGWTEAKEALRSLSKAGLGLRFAGWYRQLFQR